ncbi:hypothetical protein CEXT_55561 [Caerostris extrusa]|uniref:Uncharacterized protein n=1 Tax=Caerostris extrusa TaxID=172846 RepID=A0AAV4ND61_CAEEX|nr:hypothetical protein CEXT_55561 [Caerostris extrusa]
MRSQQKKMGWVEALLAMQVLQPEYYGGPTWMVSDDVKQLNNGDSFPALSTTRTQMAKTNGRVLLLTSTFLTSDPRPVPKKSRSLSIFKCRWRLSLCKNYLWYSFFSIIDSTKDSEICCRRDGRMIRKLIKHFTLISQV